MQWKSKITGKVVNVYDAFNSELEYCVAIFTENQDVTTDRPQARLKYSEFIEVFEKVEDANV